MQRRRPPGLLTSRAGASWCTLLCGLSGLSSVSALILPAWLWLDFGLTTSSETLTHSRSGINS